MTKRTNEIPVGENVVYRQEGNMLWFGIDTTYEGSQTEGSKGVDKKGRPKQPQEMVGSTRSFIGVPGTTGRLMLHFIRPMDARVVAADARKARALRELDDEDEAGEAGEPQLNLAALKGIDASKLAKLLALVDDEA